MAETKESALQLREDVAKKFKLKGITHAGEIRFMRQMIDLSKIDLAKAEELVKAGCTVLEPINAPAASPAPAGGGK